MLNASPLRFCAPAAVRRLLKKKASCPPPLGASPHVPSSGAFQALVEALAHHAAATAPPPPRERSHARRGSTGGDADQDTDMSSSPSSPPVLHALHARHRPPSPPPAVSSASHGSSSAVHTALRKSATMTGMRLRVPIGRRVAQLPPPPASSRSPHIDNSAADHHLPLPSQPVEQTQWAWAEAAADEAVRVVRADLAPRVASSVAQLGCIQHKEDRSPLLRGAACLCSSGNSSVHGIAACAVLVASTTDGAGAVPTVKVRPFVGVNFLAHRLVNASGVVLKGLLKGCAEQNALGAFAANGAGPYSAIHHVVLHGRHHSDPQQQEPHGGPQVKDPAQMEEQDDDEGPSARVRPVPLRTMFPCRECWAHLCAIHRQTTGGGGLVVTVTVDGPDELATLRRGLSLAASPRHGNEEEDVQERPLPVEAEWSWFAQRHDHLMAALRRAVVCSRAVADGPCSSAAGWACGALSDPTVSAAEAVCANADHPCLILLDISDQIHKSVSSFTDL